MIRIVTDNASDITQAQAREMSIEVVPIDIVFEDGVCPQNEDADFDVFYERLQKCDKLPITSRPSPQAYLDIYLDAKAKGEDVVVIALSGGLSGTVESAEQAKAMAEYDRIHVIDSHQAILTQRLLVEMAVGMREDGYTAAEITERVLHYRDRVVVCGVVDTLKYLRKGGRIPPALNVLGKMLNIKPVIILEDTKLKVLGKVRGHQAGVRLLHQRMQDDGCNKAYPVYFGYTTGRENGIAFMEKTREKFGLTQVRMHRVGGIIGTHCGTDCVAVAYVKSEE